MYDLTVRAKTREQLSCPMIVKEGDIFVDKRVVKAAPYRATNALTCHAKDIFSYEGTDGAED